MAFNMPCWIYKLIRYWTSSQEEDRYSSQKLQALTFLSLSLGSSSVLGFLISSL